MSGKISGQQLYFLSCYEQLIYFSSHLAYFYALCIQNLPLARLPKLVLIGHVSHHFQVNARFAMGPGAKFHCTILRVKRKVSHVNAARALQNCRRHPRHLAVVRDDRLRVLFDMKVAHGRVVENNVRFPNVVGGDAYVPDSVVLAEIPPKFVIIPALFQPQLCLHYLTDFINLD